MKRLLLTILILMLVASMAACEGTKNETHLAPKAEEQVVLASLENVILDAEMDKEIGVVLLAEGGKTYDIIFDTVGKISFSRCKNSLSPNGLFLEAGIAIAIFPHVLWTAIFGSKKVLIAATGLRPAGEKAKDLYFLKELIESGKIKPVVDRSYPLEHIIEAHAYVEKGHKRGNVAISI